MAPLSIPRTAEDLTAGWLTAALRHVGVLREARVTRVARTALGVESGLTSEVVRLRLTYSADASGAPASLVAKLASADPAVRARQHHRGGNPAREMHLYRDLSAALPLRTPRCLHAAVEAADGWYVLLLEDLGDARPGDEDSGCSTVDLAAALRAAARMHAAFWQSPRLAELVWLRRPVVPKAERGTVFLPMLERVAVRLGADLSPALLDHLALVAEAVARGRAGPRGPHTLVHGDFSPKNMVFRDGEEGAEVVIFDWQQAASGSAARDVAPLIVLGLPPERLRVEADALLRLYHAALREAGVDRWSFDQLLRDYRAELLQRMIAAVGLAGTVAEPAPTRLTTARRLLERAQIALEGFDPLPLLTGAE